jgi:hypothetical protein
MTPVEVKIMLLRKGLSFADMARQLEPESDATRRSLEVMIADLLYGRRWYPALALQLKEKWNIKVSCPPHLRPIRQQIRQAA